MTPTLQSFIDESQKICDAATPGPWHGVIANKPDNTGGIDYGILDQSDKVIAETFENVGEGNVCGFDKRPASDNGRLIVYARTALPQALQYLREVADERDLLKVHNRELRELALENDTLTARVAELEGERDEMREKIVELQNDIAGDSCCGYCGYVVAAFRLHPRM